jgi:hypothetical protein
MAVGQTVQPREKDAEAALVIQPRPLLRKQLCLFRGWVLEFSNAPAIVRF